MGDAEKLLSLELSELEFEIIRRHTRIGYEILKDSPSHYLQLGATIALYHHERFDGSGYPEGLSGEQIPLAARIVAVADVFDALTTARPYKRAWAVEEAVTYIRSPVGTHFDPRCVEAFLARVDEIRGVRKRLHDVLGNYLGDPASSGAAYPPRQADNGGA